MKVLNIEDNIVVSRHYQSQLGEAHAVLMATSMRDARVLLAQNSDINLVILDGLVPLFADEKLRKTTSLAYELAEMHPNVTVVAASSDDGLNRELLACGAHYSIPNKSVAALREIVTTLSKTTE